MASRGRKRTRREHVNAPLEYEKSGGVLLSQGLSSQVPSALEGLTSVFGMGTGVTPPLWTPKSVVNCGRHRAWRCLRGRHSEHEQVRRRRTQALGRLVPVS